MTLAPHLLEVGFNAGEDRACLARAELFGQPFVGMINATCVAAVGEGV